MAAILVQFQIFLWGNTFRIGSALLHIIHNLDNHSLGYIFLHLNILYKNMHTNLSFYHRISRLFKRFVITVIYIYNLYLKINDSSTRIFSMFVSEKVALFSVVMIIVYLTEFFSSQTL